MTKETALPGDGDVKLTLAGEDVVLKPTLAACLGISRLAGGATEVVTRIAQLNFDTIVAVIALGMDRPPDKKLQQKVYDNGLLKLTGPLIEFVTIVNNGGRRVNATEEDEEKQPENPPES